MQSSIISSLDRPDFKDRQVSIPFPEHKDSIEQVKTAEAAKTYIDSPPTFNSKFRIRKKTPRSRIFGLLELGWPFWSTSNVSRYDDVGQIVGWKPITLQGPTLGAFIFISLSMIVLLEVLSRISAREENGGGLAFAADVNGISVIATFGFTYLPTILAVCYSMLWGWVDLDVKRLEPWFQLSQKDGATASDSLLLQYPFDFLPFVPITALRRRHWGVFSAGFIMLTIFWIITPLQSAIFTTGMVTRTINTTMGTSASLTPFSQQVAILATNFIETAYGVAWLSQQTPPYSTNEIAFMPFQRAQAEPHASFTELWTTTTDAVYTNLSCTPALVERDVHQYTFSNGRGCVVPQVSLPAITNETNFMVTYVGYFDDSRYDWSLKGPNCSTSFSNNFLALWAPYSPGSEFGVFDNLTALFCEPNYTLETMSVTINASSHVVQHFIPTNGTSSDTTVGGIFNTSNFEYLIANGVPTPSRKQNFSDEAVLQQNSRIQDYGILWPSSIITGFAVGLSNSPVAEWSDPEVLERVFEKAHQLLFTTAFTTLLIPLNTPEDIKHGLRQDTLGAVILVRTISIIVEIGFGVIIVFSICLWHYCRHRRSLMPCDPASIGDIMSMIPPNGELSADMHDNGRLTSSLLDYNLSKKRYQLIPEEPGVSYIYPVQSQYIKKSQSRSSVCSSMKGTSQEITSSPVRPSELRLVFGLSFIGVLLAAFFGILFLYYWGLNHQGIPLPTDNAIILSIIENYAPTAFATLVEPMWNILNRLLCLLKPFEELRLGNAPAATSLKAKYTNLPPQLSIWRAIRSKHFLLAATCLTAISSNILAVALSALISQGTTITEVYFDSAHQFSPRFNGTPIFSPSTLSTTVYFDHFYAVMSNLSSGNPLRPWTDQNFYYLPFDINPTIANINPNAKLRSFTGLTHGFGVNVTCVELTTTESNDSMLFELNNNGTKLQFATSHSLPDGTIIPCVHPRSQHILDHLETDTANDLAPFTDGATALEAVQSMTARENTTDGGFCEAVLIMGWVRVSPTKVAISSGTTLANRDVSKTFLSCTQNLLVAQFEVTIDANGLILNSNRTTEFTIDIDQYFSPDAVVANNSRRNIFGGTIHSEPDLLQASTALIASYETRDFVWHNDSTTSDWMNSLLGMMLKSTGLVNPLATLPNATFMAPQVESLYATLFATLLSLNTHVFPTSSEKLAARASYLETRLFISPLMFRLSIGILSLQIIVAALFYSNRPKRFLPRMPTSIASVIAFVAASRAVDDFNGADKKQNIVGEEIAEEMMKYGYGRFIGTDGRTKVGIEKQRYVVPLEVKNPYVQRRKWWKVRKHDEGVVNTWI